MIVSYLIALIYGASWGYYSADVIAVSFLPSLVHVLQQFFSKYKQSLLLIQELYETPQEPQNDKTTIHFHEVKMNFI